MSGPASPGTAGGPLLSIFGEGLVVSRSRYSWTGAGASAQVSARVAAAAAGEGSGASGEPHLGQSRWSTFPSAITRSAVRSTVTVVRPEHWVQVKGSQALRSFARPSRDGVR